MIEIYLIIWIFLTFVLAYCAGQHRRDTDNFHDDLAGGVVCLLVGGVWPALLIVFVGALITGGFIKLVSKWK